MTGKVTFRRGVSGDALPIRAKMLQQLMNPLSIEHERFLVAAAEASGERVGFGQIRPLDDTSWELASIFVEAEWRRQGVGSELVRRLLAEHAAAGRSEQDVYLLCLEGSVGWYSTFGFDALSPSEAPESMAFEVAAGGVLTKLLGERLTCMRRVAARALDGD